MSTLYDMIPELRPELFTANPHLAKKEYLERSDLIISISATSAREMLDFWPHLSSREIAVVALGVGESMHPGGPRHVRARPYILHVGARAGYKNFSVILKALAIGESALDDVDLIAVGGGPLTLSEQAEIGALGLAARVQRLDASDLTLASLYRGALAFVFPSIHEGFGLPTLEAMACGCPAILADTPVFREVAGNAADYFNPTSAEELAGCIEVALTRGAPEQEVVRAGGLMLTAQRTWKHVTADTGQAYQRIL